MPDNENNKRIDEASEALKELAAMTPEQRKKRAEDMQKLSKRAGERASSYKTPDVNLFKTR